MREILFRGLHRRKGEKVKLNGMPVEGMWVYGGYCQYNAERGIIYQKEPFNKFSVYADSVGQYTSLTDKNGKMIFEGDVLRLVYNGTEHIYVVIWDNDDLGFKATNGQENYGKEFEYLGCCEELEVIGNIHDNPELIETN